jgi:hypothetical protein
VALSVKMNHQADFYSRPSTVLYDVYYTRRADGRHRKKSLHKYNLQKAAGDDIGRKFSNWRCVSAWELNPEESAPRSAQLRVLILRDATWLTPPTQQLVSRLRGP